MNESRSKTGSSPRKRILIVDRHPLVRGAVAHSINGTPDLEVCGEASSVAQALRLVERCHPDLVVSELALEDGAAFRLIQTLRRSRPRLPVLILSSYDEVFLARRSLKVGACGYLMKRASVPTVLVGIRRALRGELVLSAVMARKLPRFMPPRNRTVGAKRGRAKTGRRRSHREELPRHFAE